MDKNRKVESSGVSRERSPGFLYLIALLISIFLLLYGLRFGGQELRDIYSTAMTLCLSCIGLGQINFIILGSIGIVFVLFMIAYWLFGRKKHVN